MTTTTTTNDDAPCHPEGIPAAPRDPRNGRDHLQNESINVNFAMIRTNHQNEEFEQCHPGVESNDDNDNESSLPTSGAAGKTSISLSHHYLRDAYGNHDDDAEVDVLQTNHSNYDGNQHNDPLDNQLSKNISGATKNVHGERVENQDDGDDDDDDMTVIPLTTFASPRFGMMTTTTTTTTTLIPPPPPPMHTILWLEQNTVDMEQLRRRIIQVTLQRVQRNAALTMACLCLVPLLLALVILVAARELVGRGSHCQDDMVLAMNLTCRTLPRRFLNAFASQCVCDGIAMTTQRQPFNGREL